MINAVLLILFSYLIYETFAHCVRDNHRYYKLERFCLSFFGECCFLTVLKMTVAFVKRSSFVERTIRFLHYMKFSHTKIGCSQQVQNEFASTGDRIRTVTATAPITKVKLLSRTMSKFVTFVTFSNSSYIIY